MSGSLVFNIISCEQLISISFGVKEVICESKVIKLTEKWFVSFSARWFVVHDMVEAFISTIEVKYVF